jgi:hypothetical protein
MVTYRFEMAVRSGPLTDARLPTPASFAGSSL